MREPACNWFENAKDYGSDPRQRADNPQDHERQQHEPWDIPPFLVAPKNLHNADPNRHDHESNNGRKPYGLKQFGQHCACLTPPDRAGGCLPECLPGAYTSARASSLAPHRRNPPLLVVFR